MQVSSVTTKTFVASRGYGVSRFQYSHFKSMRVGGADDADAGYDPDIDKTTSLLAGSSETG